MNSLSIDITFHGKPDFGAGQFPDSVPGILDCAVETAGLIHDSGAELSIVFADDDFLQELNRKWRNKDTPTNVLAFPADNLEPGEGAGPHLGDIVVSLDTAEREAELDSKHFDDHLTHLVVHGFLHLFGYDHQDEDQADTMESLERAILAKLNIADPYEND